MLVNLKDSEIDMTRCPRTGASVIHTGRHLLIDLFGASNLADADFIQRACEDAALATGATILGSNFHHFGKDQGVSGVVLLAESHLSIHTWPEFGVATADVFVCGNCDPNLAVPVLRDRLLPCSDTVTMMPRGHIPHNNKE